MEHTKKFVLVDPRFVRPSMHDKVLSRLDMDISSILNSDETDEVKAKSYITALARYKNLSAPPKPEKSTPPASIPVPPTTSSTVKPKNPSVSFKTKSPPKRRHKRVRVDTDPTLWRRTQRTPMKKKFSPQWLTFDEEFQPKKRRSRDGSVCKPFSPRKF